jgi:hypothetical protein
MEQSPPQARSMRCSIIRVQQPQSEPAPQARATSVNERAPSRMAASTWRSVTDWQMQRIIGLAEIENESQFQGAV